MTRHRIDPAQTYRDLAPSVLGYVRSQGLAGADAEDVVGETFLQVARDAGGFKGEAGDVRRWVFTIARHRLIDHRRATARRPADPTDDVAARAPQASAVENGEPDLGPDPELIAALAKLSDAQREVIALRFVADLDAAAVAEVTGATPEAVRQMQSRALRALRDEMSS